MSQADGGCGRAPCLCGAAGCGLDTRRLAGLSRGQERRRRSMQRQRAGKRFLAEADACLRAAGSASKEEAAAPPVAKLPLEEGRKGKRDGDGDGGGG